MNLCSHNHDEICYEGRDCPLCNELEEIKSLNAEIAKLEAQIKQLENQE